MYEVCEDMIMSVVYQDIFQYCLAYTKKDDTTYINNHSKPIPDIPESIQTCPNLEEYALQLNQIIDHTSSRDKARVITNIMKRAPNNSSADDIIVFMCVILQKKPYHRSLCRILFYESISKYRSTFLSKR